MDHRSIGTLYPWFFLTLLFKLEIDPDLKNYFPKTMNSMVNTDRIEEIFGNQDLVMIIFEAEDILAEETLKRVQIVEKEIGRIDGVREHHRSLAPITSMAKRGCVCRTNHPLHSPGMKG